MKLYLAGAVLGSLFGVLLYVIQPVQWEAQALVRLAQIYQPSSKTLIQSPNQSTSEFEIVEAIPIVIERLKSRSFMLAASKRAKENGVTDILNEDECSCLIIKPIKSNDALIISMVGSTPELAQVSVDAVVEELKFKHSIMLDDYKSGIERKVLALDGEVESLSKRIGLLADNMQMSKGKADEVVSKEILMMTLQATLENKKSQSAELRDLTSSFHSRGTELLEPIFVKEKRLFSSPWRACLLGTLLGLFLCVLWVRWKK